MTKLDSNISKSAVNAAGVEISKGYSTSQEYNDALVVVNKFRLSHAQPMNVLAISLKRKVKGFEGVIIAQRLKRLPTIANKLCRYPSMNLSRMQDIGGTRVIVGTIDELYELRAMCINPRSKSVTLKNEHDYVVQPKPDGYRGIHLVYNYSRTADGAAINVSLELQIRTNLQHAWATAVETVGVMRGESLKSQVGNAKWLEFFEYVSSAFAIAESVPVLSKHSSYSTRNILDQVRRLTKELNVIEIMEGWFIATDQIHRNNAGGYYNIITLNTNTRTISILGFSEDRIDDASAEYALLETSAAINGDLEPVLVSAGSINDLRKAYPNYFLDVDRFISWMRGLADETKSGI
jgi:putative GTP pyrophosphokinase